MKRKNKNFYFSILLLILPSFFAAGLVFAQGRGLEIEYPGLGLRTIKEDIFPVYVKYIFNFIIGISGFIAFGALIRGGIRYLLSSGEPEKLTTAKKQMLAAFWGIIILSSAYLILININPQLTLVKVPGLEEIEDVEIIIPRPPDRPPDSPPVYPNQFWRITEIASTVKNVLSDPDKGIEKIGQDIRFYTLGCSCEYTHPLCLCQDYMGSCESLYCYSEKPTEPCPNSATIKKRQQDIVASMFEILYYKNRAAAERKDFLLRINNLEQLISHYNEKIEAEKDFLENLEKKGAGEEAGKTEKGLIKAWEEEISKLSRLRHLFQRLEEKLNELTVLVDDISQPIDKISKLPDECLPQVKTVCSGTCEGGCHNSLGCFPLGCGGGNPCPVNEIQNKLSEIQSFKGRINRVCDEIIKIVSDIIKIE